MTVPLLDFEYSDILPSIVSKGLWDWFVEVKPYAMRPVQDQAFHGTGPNLVLDCLALY